MPKALKGRKRQERNSMSLFFQSRKPRKFHHVMIYYDERKERLHRLERQAKEEVAEPLTKGENDIERRMNFIGNRQVWQNHRRNNLSLACSIGVMVLVLFILVFLLIYE